jgi:hypothetical protein
MKFLLVLLVFFAQGCDQTGLAVKSAVTNFFTTPVDAVSDIFSDQAYRRRAEATTAQSAAPPASAEVRYCIQADGTPVPRTDLEALASLGAGVRNSVCQCEAWGTCPREVCPCATLCPAGFHIFRHPAGITPRTLSQEANGLAFRNESVGQHEMTAGYCWGHARLTSQFNRLAFFKPEQRPPYDLSSTNADEQLQATRYYRDLIDRITRNQAVDIPGFANLNELSDHPALQSYLGDKMARSWADQAMSWQGLFTAADGSQQSNASYERLFAQVKERIDMHMQPTIVFTDRDSPFNTHAVLVSHYETLPDGRLKLCIRDNNHPEANAASCRDAMTIHPSRGLEYSAPGWGPVGEAKIAHNENADAAAQAASLERKCQREKDCGVD